MVFSCRGKTQCVGNVHNVSSMRVAEFNYITCSHGPHGEPLRVDVKLVLTNFDFHLNAFFIKLCPNCDISM